MPLDSQSKLIFLGDYIDRGEDSKEVINVILQLKKKYKVIALRGNHEDMFLDFIDHPDSEKAALFVYNGGGPTLASYGNAQGEIHYPEEHLEFFHNLPFFYEEENFFNGSVSVDHGFAPIELAIKKLGANPHESFFIASFTDIF